MDEQIHKPPLKEVCREFLKIGAIGYGGPAILSLIQEEIVKKKKWLSQKDFLEGLALSQTVPGSSNVNLAAYIGYRLWGKKGISMVPLYYIFPAFILMITLSFLYLQFGQLPFVKSIFEGLGAVVVILILKALWDLGKTSISDWLTTAIAFGSFGALYYFKTELLTVLVWSAIAGFFFYYLRPRKFGLKREIQKKKVELK
ncbi:MAG: chromate transporter [Candidatus Micrarchaeia archaeon]